MHVCMHLHVHVFLRVCVCDDLSGHLPPNQMYKEQGWGDDPEEH